ncbi:formylglycine-generating enzyme family protein [Chloroflexota bacterium]
MPEKQNNPKPLSVYRRIKSVVILSRLRNARFVAAGGYESAQWWTETGWHWREQNNITEPYHWTHPNWTKPERLPVIGVSWYEAWAYTQWLAESSGLEFRLPIEAEWEKAARGVDGRINPWGDDASREKCNSMYADISKTSVVGRFSPQGDSPYGCADMAGNVWEWTLTQWGWLYQHAVFGDFNFPEGDNPRIAKGGSWIATRRLVRAAVRSRGEPDKRDDYHGFRVVCARHYRSNPA